MFHIGRAMHWAFADGLGVNPKAYPETIDLAILILRQVAKVPPEGLLTENLKDKLHPRRILHAPGP